MQHRFDLPVELNIYSAMATRDALVAWLSELSGKGAYPVGISADNVAEIDGAGLQLLAALNNTQTGWQLLGASTVFADACRVMGFGQWLDDSQTPNASGPTPSTTKAKPNPTEKTEPKAKTKSRMEPTT